MPCRCAGNGAHWYGGGGGGSCDIYFKRDLYECDMISIAHFNLMHIFADGTLPDLPQRLKIFSLLRVIFAVLANRVSAQIADAVVALCNVLVSVYDRFDIVCVEDDIVFELELAVVVRYAEVYSAAAFASVNNCEEYHISFTHNGKQSH